MLLFTWEVYHRISLWLFCFHSWTSIEWSMIWLSKFKRSKQRLATKVWVGLFWNIAVPNATAIQDCLTTWKCGVECDWLVWRIKLVVREQVEKPRKGKKLSFLRFLPCSKRKGVRFYFNRKLMTETPYGHKAGVR